MTERPAKEDRRPVARAAVRGARLSGLVTLFTIDMGPSMLRLLAGQAGGGAVGFGGETYAAFPLAAKGFAWTADGPPAHPQIELSNLSRLFDGAVADDGLRGRMVRRIITLADQLDPPHGAGGGACFPSERWIIEQVVRLDRQVLRLELAAEASLENRRFPERVMLRDLCQHRYRRWDAARRSFDYEAATCPYVGDRFFTAEGTPTADPAKDSCALSLESGCKKRFSGALPFVGFPGLTRL
ncbi:MAG: phage minor tail protein L [Candidatus Puniceispirillaceae bacterium]